MTTGPPITVHPYSHSCSSVFDQTDVAGPTSAPVPGRRYAIREGMVAQSSYKSEARATQELRVKVTCSSVNWRISANLHTNALASASSQNSNRENRGISSLSSWACMAKHGHVRARARARACACVRVHGCPRLCALTYRTARKGRSCAVERVTKPLRHKQHYVYGGS